MSPRPLSVRVPLQVVIVSLWSKYMNSPIRSEPREVWVQWPWMSSV
ncbi:hypothetical protein [Nocardioides sp. TF02-7]|nr:hypothetical protein [Nocardioides sp. TF02-7]UMG94348.1 hypothetical protein MF408_10290 [Nocardioides sp. TF02-7]